MTAPALYDVQYAPEDGALRNEDGVPVERVMELLAEHGAVAAQPADGVS